MLQVTLTLAFDVVSHPSISSLPPPFLSGALTWLPYLSFLECCPMPVASKAEPDHGWNWKWIGKSVLRPQQKSEVFHRNSPFEMDDNNWGEGFDSPLLFVPFPLWWGSTLLEKAAGTK